MRAKPTFVFRGLRMDSPRVMAAVADGARKALSQFGAMVRVAARRSLRPANYGVPPSAPGQPPRSRTGLLRDFIFFGWDPATRAVVVGPARLLGRRMGRAPSLLEYGGVASAMIAGRRRKIRHPARPYIRPAFSRVKERLPALWRDSVQ